MGQVSSTPCSCRAFSATRTVDCHDAAAVHLQPQPPASARDLTLCLPDECLACVFVFLPSNDRNSCSLVCKRWKSVDAKSRQRLLLAARSEISASLPAILSRFIAVSALSLKCSRKLVSIDDHGLSLIPSRLVSLKKLKLKGCVDVSDDGLHAFSLNCPPLLAKISFASCGFGARGVISLLCNCPSLRDLTLKRLRKLDAQNTPLSMDAYFDEMKQKPSKKFQLERLCLKDLHNARIFAPLLCSAKSLKTLIVCRSSGNWDRVLESLQFECQDPTVVSEIQMENVQLGDTGLIAISQSCPELEVLFLSRVSDCTDDGLSAIANSCRSLRKLHIDAWTRFGGRSISDEGVAMIGSKSLQLQELVLMGVPARIASLNVLASNCSILERMALCNTETVGDPEMGVIAEKFSALKKLCIKNCPISLKGIEAVVLEGCPNLVKLKVKRCRGVSSESVSHLKLLRTDLVISVDAGALVVDGDASENDDGGASRRRIRAATAAAAAPELGNNGTSRRITSTSTHVICSSRGASLLRSRFARSTGSAAR